MTRAEVLERHREVARAVTAVLRETADPSEALAEILRLTAQAFAWDVAQLWTIDANVEVLRWSDAWIASDEFREFVAASQMVRFAQGEDLPGRIWESGGPAWVRDVLDDLNVPRAAAAGRAGLRTGVGFAVRASARTFGFVEFFSREVRAADADLTAALESIAVQIGHVVQRALIARDRDRLLGDAIEAGQARDQLAAMLSHELRTPVNAMVGWLQMARSGDLDEAARVHALEVVERNARVLAQLIEDLIDLTRMTRGTIRLTLEPCMPADSVHAALDSVQPAATAREIALERRVDPAAGPVHADRDRLQQIVWNLASNAIKYTPRGGAVRVALERTGAAVRLTVSDTGQGITPEFLPHAFEPFRQADAANRPSPAGMGLGLAIVKQLVTMHGGTVEAESDGEGRGATFTVTLPLAG